MTESSTAPAPPPDNDTGRLDHASRARIFSVIVVVVLFAEVAPLQYTMVSPAAQLIGRSFPGVGSNIAWMTIVFGLVGGAATPILGKLSDLYGKRNMLLAVGVSFLFGSVICATTSNWTLFLIGRAFQAVAIAAATVAYGLIRDLIPRKYVPLAIGLVSTGLGVSGVGGIMLSGVLTDSAGWSYKSLFWFLTIYTLVTLPLVFLICPETKFRARQKLDPLGALLLAGGVGFGLLYVSNGANVGWTDPLYLGYLILGLLLIAAFVALERRVSQPIIDLKLLFSPQVSVVLFIGFFAAIVVGIQAFAIPYMVSTPSHSELIAAAQQGAAARFKGMVQPNQVPVKVLGDVGYALGFTLLGLAFHVQVYGSSVSMVSGAASGQLSGKIGARRPLLLGMFAFALTSGIYAAWHHGALTLALVGVVFGVGFGAYYATTPNLLVEASPPEQQGITAGMLGVSNSIGTAVGTAIAAAFQAAHPVKLVVAGQTVLAGTPDPKTGITERAAVFTDAAYTQIFIACAIAGLIALIGTYFMRSGRTPSTGGLGYLSESTPAKQAATA
ncbi:MFS transporter [Catenulispora sp. NF23]|uniref:MFS transporter n=1 Tax=Catenulispora pinistramenti TaxID=2705254 RepID=UPI001BA7C8BC|nr:MFS transporter [Catenulispora pinistramenti]MBS2532373.1 MFS transporter [Catenulispora pinistramenti]